MLDFKSENLQGENGLTRRGEYIDRRFFKELTEDKTRENGEKKSELKHTEQVIRFVSCGKTRKLLNLKDTLKLITRRGPFRICTIEG